MLNFTMFLWKWLVTVLYKYIVCKMNGFVLQMWSCCVVVKENKTCWTIFVVDCVCSWFLSFVRSHLAFPIKQLFPKDFGMLLLQKCTQNASQSSSWLERFRFVTYFSHMKQLINLCLRKSLIDMWGSSPIVVISWSLIHSLIGDVCLKIRYF